MAQRDDKVQSITSKTASVQIFVKCLNCSRFLSNIGERLRPTFTDVKLMARAHSKSTIAIQLKEEQIEIRVSSNRR